MNILLFFTPKAEVVYLEYDCSVRQAIEKMRHHGYASLPVIDDEGIYKGVVTDGDLLRELYNDGEPELKRLEKTPLKTILHRDYHPINADVSIDEVLSRVYKQNFVPVTDDRGVFIGIIKRRDIIKYLAGVKVDIPEDKL